MTHTEFCNYIARLMTPCPYGYYILHKYVLCVCGGLHFQAAMRPPELIAATLVNACDPIRSVAVHFKSSSLFCSTKERT